MILISLFLVAGVIIQELPDTKGVIECEQSAQSRK